MNDDVAKAWAEAIYILGVSQTDVEKSAVIRKGLLVKDFLSLINKKLSGAGTEKSTKFLTAILPAYPPVALRSANYSRSTINSYIQRNASSYEPDSIPFEFIIAPDEPAVIDLLSALKSMVSEGLDISGIKALYADSGESLQLILYLDISNYKVLITPAPSPDGESHKAIFGFVNTTTPVVKCEGFEYRLAAMRDGFNPWKVLYYCWKDRLGAPVTRDELKAHTKITGRDGISEMLRKSPQASLVSKFIEVTPSSVTLKKIAWLTTEELETIKSRSEKPIPISE